MSQNTPAGRLNRALRQGATAAILAVLAACGTEQATDASRRTDELRWTRAALERNPDLEVVAEDPEKGVLTVRDRRSGELLALRPDDIAAVPLSHLAGALSRDRVAETVLPEQAAATTPEPATAEEAAPPGTAASAQVETQAATDTKAPLSPYTIEREAGRVRVTGPGVSIESAGPATTAEASRTATATTTEPIICEGRRLLHIDGRDLHVDGDAVIARGGCELHITNSRIVATGVGVAAHDATVHIRNSYIEGSAGSLDASGRARIYARGTTFEGLSRRHDAAEISDLGGNDWG